MTMTDIHLVEKMGGKSRAFHQPPHRERRELVIDREGRWIDYLRISITDRCNLALSVLHAGVRGGKYAP